VDLKKIGVLVGGRSPESEVSLCAAPNLIRLVRANDHEPVLIGIAASGAWFLQDPNRFKDRQLVLETQVEVSLPFGSGSMFHSGRLEKLDAVFPALHGPYGEDGAVQGLLKMANIPFVGEDVLASAVCMDKACAKQLLIAAGLPVPPSRVLHAEDLPLKPRSIFEELGSNLFVKPCNAGSSIGVSRVSDEETLHAAIEEAFRYDRKILIEQSIQPCREICCGLMGRPTRVSLPGEIIVDGAFYSYEKKSKNVSLPFAVPALSNRFGQAVQNLTLEAVGALKPLTYARTPAVLPDTLRQRVQDLAVAAFEALGCDTMARVDLFLDRQEKLYVNEVNTMPAFDRFSAFPRLWEISGWTQKRLVGYLIEQAWSRFRCQQDLCNEAPRL
jgi:D-alanine-D-alanine ligase